ncbi:hypothetical protein DERP_001522, partial [Dermatophagoides pteronyssinus]
TVAFFSFLYIQLLLCFKQLECEKRFQSIIKMIDVNNYNPVVLFFAKRSFNLSIESNKSFQNLEGKMTTFNYDCKQKKKSKNSNDLLGWYSNLKTTINNTN